MTSAIQQVVTPRDRPEPKKIKAQLIMTNTALVGAMKPNAPRSTKPRMGRAHAQKYTLSRLIFEAIFGKKIRPAISAMIANPKIEYKYSFPHTFLK